jgi:hypothetical protein
MTRVRTALVLLALSGAASAAPRAPGRAARFKALIGQVFTQDSVENLQRNGKDDYHFETFDGRGYARVIGPFDGRDDFFLLPGRKGDALLFVEYSCGATCTQKASAYRSGPDGKAVHVPFKEILSLEAFDEVRHRLVALCLDSDEDFDTERASRAAAERDLPACPFALSLSKDAEHAGLAVLYSVLDSNGSGYQLSVGRTIVQAKTLLRWNGTAFVVREGPESEPVYLNTDAMQEKF